MGAIFGIFGHAKAAERTRLGIFALQHRGTESAGISSTDGKRFYTHRDMGLVADVLPAWTVSGLVGTAAIGHTRYSTAGGSTLLNAQPLTARFGKGEVAIVHNGNLTNADGLRSSLQGDGAIFQTSADTELFLHLMARAQSQEIATSLEEAFALVEGAYSVLILTHDALIAARDPRGFRPLEIGRLSIESRDAWVFASETCAFDLIGASHVGEVEPGEMVVASADGLLRRRFAEERECGPCLYEEVYFARPDSVVFGQPVYEIRTLLGRVLAKEHPVEADLVVPVPDSGVPAAIGYAEAAHLPYGMAITRNHYVGRILIQPTQEIRDLDLKLKFNVVRNLVDRKRVVMVDDSIVRGGTSRKLVAMLREAGAREVHVRVSCPPTISPCYYGIDTPRKEDLIASESSVEEICKQISADSLGFLSLEGLRKAAGDLTGKGCHSCWSGQYSTNEPRQ